MHLLFKNEYMAARGSKSGVPGISLFTPLKDRNCKEASIPEYLCACNIRINGADIKSPFISEAAQFMVNHINMHLLKNYSNLCMQLEPARVLEVQGFLLNPDKFSIIFQVKPNLALFDASFVLKKHEFNEEHSFQLIGQIVRINEYGLSSKCIENYFLKNFCFCFDFHRKKNQSQSIKIKTHIPISSTKSPNDEFNNKTEKLMNKTNQGIK